MLVFALALSFAIGSLFPFTRASAADYSPSQIFSAGTGGSVTNSDADENGDNWAQFTLNAKGSVHYRRDLALKWYEGYHVDEDESEEEGEAEATALEEEFVGTANLGVRKYFTVTFSFAEINFTKFTLTFESAEENVSKKGVSSNALVFYYKADKLTVAVKNAAAFAAEEDDDWEPADEALYTLNAEDDFAIAFSESAEYDCANGEFAVCINGEFVGKFTNIGGNYLEYLSSASSTPRVPMTFTADELKEGAENQKVLMKELNGQSFKLVNGQVKDNAAPALVLNEEIYAYTLGKRWSLTYEMIDVCRTSVTVTRRFAMLKAPDDDGLYTKPEKDDYEQLTTNTVFMPTTDLNEKEEQYVSIYFDLDDGTTLTDEEKEARRIYLTWYCADGATATLGSGEQEFDYILVNRKTGGPHYIGLEADEASKENLPVGDFEERVDFYQEEVLKASEDLSAGSGSYFYMPSLRGLIGSNYTDYRNLRFNVYYKKQGLEPGNTASGATSLRYNALRFEVDQEGEYLFKVFASDASSNSMAYYLDGQLVTLTSTNVWQIEEIPSFHFNVTYKGATIEDPDEQSLGYVDSTYTITSFDVHALSGYEREYSLYRLDTSDLGTATALPAYSDFVADAKTYVEQFRSSLIEIKTYNSNVTEDDTDRWNRTDNRYHWNPDTSLSFIPQEAGFYIVELVVTEAYRPGHTVSAYQIIDVRNRLQTPPDPTYWLENNVTSVVLFSVSALLFIVIVILMVVKPSEKNLEEVDLKTLKGGKKDKKNKK